MKLFLPCNKLKQITIVYLTGFCPDESPSQETDAIDLTNDMKRMGPELFNQFVRILNNEGGLQKMLKLLSSGVAGLKED